jgi:hypothetical protein
VIVTPSTLRRLLLAAAVGVAVGAGLFDATASDPPIQTGTYTGGLCGDYPPSGRQFDPWTGLALPTARVAPATLGCAGDPGLAGHRAFPVPFGFLVGALGAWWLLTWIGRRQRAFPSKTLLT